MFDLPTDVAVSARDDPETRTLHWSIDGNQGNLASGTIPIAGIAGSDLEMMSDSADFTGDGYDDVIFVLPGDRRKSPPPATVAVVATARDPADPSKGLAFGSAYLPGNAPEPMLLSGVALAGANRALAKKEDDGILFALEAQGLNLDGSELVVLSACDTARGSLDYAEGVYGLVRAFRTADAGNILVTLWPLNDGEARNFMAAFYRSWLAQAGRSDPAKALRETRLTYLNNPNPALRDPRVWAPYVMVE